MARVVITGANRGIGLALAKVYADRGDDVLAVCRSASPALEALPVTVCAGVDVTDDESVARFAGDIGDGSIDVLINNAGILNVETFDKLDFDGIRRQFEVNTLGPLRMTKALETKFADGAKVVIVTSRVGSIGDNGFGGIYGYRMSKAAVNMAGANLAIDFKERGIPVLLLHPGMVETDMGGTGPNRVSAKDSAERMAARIDELSMDTTGRFVHAEGYDLPW